MLVVQFFDFFLFPPLGFKKYLVLVIFIKNFQLVWFKNRLFYFPYT
jgi:hypothetical protein